MKLQRKYVKENIEDLEKVIRNKRCSCSFTGVAFVIFDNQSDTDLVLKHYEKSWFLRVIDYFNNKICKINLTRAGKTVYKGKRVFAERPPEPTDLFWENLSTRPIVQLKKSLYTYSITLVVLCITFLINLLINNAKDKLEQKARSYNGGSTADALLNGVRLLTILLTLLVVFVNFVLGKVIRNLASNLRAKSYSGL